MITPGDCTATNPPTMVDPGAETDHHPTSTRESDLLQFNSSKHSDIVSISMGEDVTMEDVGRILRLEDDRLLESLHFDTSGDTPVLGSCEGNLDDVPPLVYEAKVGKPLSGEEPSKSLLKRSTSLGEEGHLNYGQLVRRFSQGDEDVIFRQCLSGEIKSFTTTTVTSEDAQDVADGEQRKTDDDGAVPEGEETTTSSTCYSQDAASVSPMKLSSRVVVPASDTNSKSIDDKRRISSNDRKMNEAVQFAQAVGEMPPLDSKTNELCIIDEDDLDDTDDEDDNDDGNGTVIRLDELGSQIGSIHEHLSIGDNVSQDAFGNATPKIPTQESGKQPTNDIPREIIKRKTRPQWPLQLPGWTFSNLDQNSLESTVQEYVYRGIHSNPPEIVKRGMSRGNHVQLHRKAWLEVSDKYHRYGKNLRLYYRHWETLDFPTNMFFDWLDSKGEAAGAPLPNLDECPRSKLDSDTVLYINNPDVTSGYSLRIESVEGRARFMDVDDELVKTGPDGWIFVLRDGIIYGAEKITSITGQSKQRFHHSSFFGGKAVAAAGIFITDDAGFLTRLYPHSGHYRPREAHMQRLLYFLHHQGVDLRTFEMDTQQIMHVARDIIDAKGKEKCKKENGGTDKQPVEGKKEGEKKKKIDSLQLMPAVSVACYVAHKAHFIGEGIFADIHQIRNANVTSVTEALTHLKGKRRVSVRNQVRESERLETEQLE